MHVATALTAERGLPDSGYSATQDADAAGRDGLEPAMIENSTHSRRGDGIARKTAPLLVARLTAAATTLVALALTSRQLGLVQLGAVALGLTVGTLLGAVSEAGMTAWMVRETARAPDRAGRYLSVVLAMRAVMLPVASGITALLVAVVFQELAAAILVVALTVAVQQVAETGRGVFIARGSMVVAGLHGTLENLIWLAAVAAGLWTGQGTVVAFGLGLAVVCLSSVSIVVIAWAAEASLCRFSQDDLRGALRELPVFGTFSVASAAYQRSDTILVALLMPTGAVAAAGAYFGATRLVAAFEYLPQTVGRAVLPDVARARRPGAPGQVVAPAVRMMLALSVPVPFAMVLGGEWVLQQLLGTESTTFGWIMAWLALALPFRFVAYLYGTLLTGADAQAVRVRALLLSLGVLIVIDVITVPTLGIAGAVLGFLSSSVTLFLLYERDARRTFGLADTARQLFTPLLVSCVAAAPALVIRRAASDQVAAPAALAVFSVTYLTITGMLLLRSRAKRVRSSQGGVDAAG